MSRKIVCLASLALLGLGCGTVPCWERAQPLGQAVAIDTAMAAAFPGLQEPLARQCERANLDFATAPVVWPDHDKDHILVASDLHAGLKGEGDDLRVGGETYAALLRSYGDGNSQLVLAGDTFDLAEAEVLLREHSAKEHVQRIAENHIDLFGFFADWIRQGNDLVFIPGNHDTALQVAEVRAQVVLEIARRMPGVVCREDPRAIVSHTFFVPALYRVGPVLVTHGHQADVANRTKQSGMHVDGEACRFDRTDGFQAIEFFTPLEQTAGWLDNVQRLPEITAGMITVGVGGWVLKKVAKALEVPPEALTVELPCGELTKKLKDELEKVGTDAIDRVSGKPWEAIALQAIKLQQWGQSLVASSLETQKALRDYAVTLLRDTPGAQVLVAGHTHEPARVEKLSDDKYYVNVGTWTAADASLGSCEEAELHWRKPNGGFSSRSPVAVINLDHDRLVAPLPRIFYLAEESRRQAGSGSR